MKVKTITLPSGEEQRLLESNDPSLACCGCGADLGPGKYMAICCDCGGVFCESCVRDHTFEKHVCEEE